MIDKEMIDKYIEIKNIGIVNQYSKNAFENTTEYYLIDKLFFSLLQEKNIKVSKYISENTSKILNKEFDSQNTINYFRKYVKNYDPDTPKIKIPWWKIW